MQFEWDPEKAERNWRDHGVRFPDAVGVFYDPLALGKPDDRFEEMRFVRVGLDFVGRLLTVAYTSREKRVRLITARLATKRERRQYEERSS